MTKVRSAGVFGDHATRKRRSAGAFADTPGWVREGGLFVPDGASAAPPEFVAASASANGNVSTATWAADVPAGVQDGDLLLACITHEATRTVTPPAGWTLVYEQVIAGTPDMRLYRKRASSESGSYTFTLNSASYGGLVVLALRNASSALVVGSNQLTTPGGGTFAADSLTVPSDDSLLLGFASVNGSGVHSTVVPASMTSRANQGSRYLSLVGGTEAVDAGATGTRTFTTSPTQSGAGAGGIMVAVRGNADDPPDLSLTNAWWASELALADGATFGTWTPHAGAKSLTQPDTSERYPTFRLADANMGDRPSVEFDGSLDTMRNESMGAGVASIAMVCNLRSDAVGKFLLGGSYTLDVLSAATIRLTMSTSGQYPNIQGKHLVILEPTGLTKDGVEQTRTAGSPPGQQLLSLLSVAAYHDGFSGPAPITVGFLAVKTNGFSAQDKADLLAWSRAYYGTP